MKLIYLDHNASTPMDPWVLDAMLPYFTEKFGNAASRHPLGWEAQEAVESARAAIAKELNARPREIIFTSGATEAINLAIRGLCEQLAPKRRHIVTQATEHPAVLETCRAMISEGWEVTILPVEEDGRVNIQRLAEALRLDTALVAVMHANHEIGVLQDIASIGRLCRENHVRFLVDAAQSFGKLRIDVEAMAVDLLAATAHKIYGPKGVGFLYVRQGAPKVDLRGQMDGGGHERGMRSGTLAVPLIVGLAKAAELCTKERKAENERLRAMRDLLLRTVLAELPDTVVNGSLEHRLSHTIHFSFPRIEGDLLLVKLESVACSSGSACAGTSLRPNHVMTALGRSDELARASLRIAFGRMNRDEDAEDAAAAILSAVASLRQTPSIRRAARHSAA